MGNYKQATYVRLSEEHFAKGSPEDDLISDPSKLIDILINKNKLAMRPPKLLISVTGGAQDFELDKNLELMLKRGLRRAAEATDAWVVTGGSNCGIMKYVGQAMSEIEHGLSNGGNEDVGKRVPTIGIATFGSLKEREELLTGHTHTFENEHKSSLDQNHDLFFLVDDGSVNQFGKEIKFRTNFEKALRQRSFENTDNDSGLASMFQNGRSKIFAVLLVVEGGE